MCIYILACNTHATHFFRHHHNCATKDCQRCVCQNCATKDGTMWHQACHQGWGNVASNMPPGMAPRKSSLESQRLSSRYHCRTSQVQRRLNRHETFRCPSHMPDDLGNSIVERVLLRLCLGEHVVACGCIAILDNRYKDNLHNRFELELFGIVLYI